MSRFLRKISVNRLLFGSRNFPYDKETNRVTIYSGIPNKRVCIHDYVFILGFFQIFLCNTQKILCNTLHVYFETTVIRNCRLCICMIVYKERTADRGLLHAPLIALIVKFNATQLR